MFGTMDFVKMGAAAIAAGFLAFHVGSWTGHRGGVSEGIERERAEWVTEAEKRREEALEARLAAQKKIAALELQNIDREQVLEALRDELEQIIENAETDSDCTCRFDPGVLQQLNKIRRTVD